jgi:predicted Zn-dependent protease
MSNPYSLLSRKFYRRLIYPATALFVALGLVVGSGHPSTALNWRDLIVPGIQVIQITTMSDEQEVNLGKQMNEQLLSSGQFKRYQNKQVNDYINAIGQRLVPASDRPDIPYTFQIIDDDVINAYATMGGFVYITTGLLQEASNEAEVAGVLAHEIGHISEKHTLKQMREQIVARGLADAAGLDSSVVVGIGLEVALRLPRSRQHEYEADRRGLETVMAANYAPSGLIAFFQKLMDKGGSSVPGFLSTHPSPENRISQLKQQVPAGMLDRGDGLNPSAYRANISPLL